MEIEAKVRSNPVEMEQYFDIDEVLNIRYYELLGGQVYKVRIRMAECNISVKGLTSLGKIKEKVIRACSEHYRIKSKVTLKNGVERVIYSCNDYWEEEYAKRFAHYMKSEVEKLEREE
ncbi:MAG: hypothetical protein KIG65_00905 [Eubacteriales bacterium]|nr:hypothetical protein [Eubacteriales bacterium]